MIALFWRVLLGIASFGLVSATVFLILVVIAAVRFRKRAEQDRASVLKFPHDQLPPVTIF
jgi:cbb3-type cytochrome oxidase subunit 3